MNKNVTKRKTPNMKVDQNEEEILKQTDIKVKKGIGSQKKLMEPN